MRTTPRARSLLIATVTAAIAASGSTPPATAFETRLGDAAFVKVGRKPGASSIPDANVSYWGFPYFASPSVRTVIRGRTPLARLWAFTIYRDAPVDNLPDPRIHSVDGKYTVTIASDCRAVRNCLEAGPGDQRGVVVLRLYDPVDIGGAETGGGALPTVSYVSPGPATAIDLGQLGLPSPFTTGAAAALQRIVDTAHRLMTQPVPSPAPVLRPDNEPAPRFEPITATWPAYVGWLQSRGAPSALVDAALKLRVPNYVFPSNRYGGAYYDSHRGNLELRFRAPTYRRPRWGPRPLNALGRTDGREQLRYWSLCTYEATLQYQSCLRDRDVVVGRDRRAVAIVAPSCPVPGYVNCLATGGDAVPDFMVIMRNTEPAPAFAARRMTGSYRVKVRYVARA